MAIRFLTAAPICALLALCAHPATAAAAPSKAASLLDAVGKATLTRPLSSIRSIHTIGTSTFAGMRGDANEYDDVPGMRFTSTLAGGALTGSNGWDGSRAWNEDYSGLVHVDGGQSGRLQGIDQAYTDNLAYLRADRGGAQIGYAGIKKAGGKSYQVVAVTPQRGSRLEFWIDPRTHLIARETTTIGITSVVSTFSDYRRVDGVMYPFKSTFALSNGNAGSTTLSAVRLNEDVASHIAMPASSVNDFSVTGSSTTVPLQVINNHLYVRGNIDGHGPYTFILDSGGDYIITPEVAREIGVKSAGGMQIQGVGNATEGVSFAHVGAISIGSATAKNQYMLVLPINTGFGIAEGVHIDGMIGYQWLARFLTTIDYGANQITFAMPRSAALTGPGVLPFYFDGSIPRINVAIDGVALDGEVDTGSRAALTLSAPFVAAHPAIGALAKTPPAVNGFGVGGPSFARLGRVHTLQIGPFSLSEPVTAFGIQQKGAFADPFNPANLGGGIWRRFTVTFDYPHERMSLAQNSAYGEPFFYDRSGLFLVDNKGAFTVISVTPGTPAAEQGFSRGDVIAGVDGKPASSMTLAGLRELLQSPAGTAVHLQVRGTKGERDVVLTLRDYV